MGAGRERDLGVAHILLRHGRTKFVGNQFIIFGRFEAARDVQVNLDEVVKVAKGEPALQIRNAVHGQVDTIPLCKDEEGSRLYGTLEVDMEFRFRHSKEVAFNILSLHGHFPSPFVLPERSALLASLLRRSLAAPAALQRCLAKKTRQRRWQDGWVPSEGGVWDGEYQKYRSNQTHVPYHRMRTSVCQSISHIGAQIHLTRALQFHDSGYGWHGGVCRCVVTVTQSHERNGLVRVQELRSEHIRV